MLQASREYRRDIPAPSGEIRLRPIESSNIAELISLGEAVGLSLWTAQCYLDELKNPNSVMLRLISDDNRLLGFIVGRLAPSSSESGAWDAEIYNIAVQPAEQRQGSGELVFRGFIDICNAEDAHNVWLEVRESNHKAIRFYRRKGFEITQKRPKFYNDPVEDAFVMKLALKKTSA